MINLFKKATLMLAFGATVLVSPLALAAAQGGFEMGDFYRGKNDTKGTAFADPVTAAPCETITLKMRLHNPGPSPVTSVNVKATIPSGTGTSFSSVATVTAADADPQTVTDSVAIQVSQSAKINYVPGSAQLLDANDGVLQTLADGALQGGVNIGDVGVSTEQKRFVQFKLKLDCPEVPVCPPGTTGTPPNCVKPPVTPPTTTTKTTPPPAATPSVIASTGPEAALAGILGSGALGYGIRQWFNSRRNLRDLLQ